jgi:hypothetical protein
MKCLCRASVLLVPLALLSAESGCTSQTKKDQARASAIAQEKVELVKRLADEVAKNPTSVDVAGIVEEFMNTPLDSQAYPAETAEILKIYNERIKGKIAGEPAMQMASAIGKLKQPAGK